MHRLIILLTIISFLAPIARAQSYNPEQEALYVAEKAYEDGFYEVSLSLLERFIRNFPQSRKAPEANLYIAQCYFQQNRFIATLAQLEKLSSDSRAESLQDAVLYWTAEVHFRGKDFRKAISFYQRIIKDFPDSNFLADAYYSCGWSLFELKEYSQAAEFFTKVVTYFPGHSLARDAQFKKLECLYNLKDYAQLKSQIDAFEKKYADDTFYTNQLHFLLAECSFYLDEYPHAVRQYQIVLKNPRSRKITVLSQIGLIWSYLKLKDYASAKDLLEGVNSGDLTGKEQELLLLAKANLFTEMQDSMAARSAWLDLQKIASEPKIKIQAYLGEADALYNSEQYTQAISVYREAGEIKAGLFSSLSGRLYYSLAWAFLKDGQFKQAIREFQRAASFASDEIIKVAALCQVGDTHQDAEEYQEAIEVYDEILTKYPDSFYVDYVQYQLGLACLRLSRYDEANLAFGALLHNFPESKLYCSAVYSLALSLFQKQDYQGCREFLQRYLPDLKKDNLEIQALYLLAINLYNLGEFSPAIDTFSRVIRQTDDLKLIQKAEYEIADCLYQLGKEKESLRRFKILRAKYPDSTLSPEVTWWLGEYYFRRNNLKLSRRYFSSLIRDFTHASLLPDGYYALGLIDQEEGKLDSAIENLKKAMETASKDLKAQAAIVVADILVQQDKFAAAEAAYEEAIKNSPALSGLIYPKISGIYEKRGDFDRVIQFYRQALSIASTKEAPGLQLKIARAYESKGDYRQAIEEYLKIPYLYPADPQLIIKAYLRGAQIYENQGDFSKAKDIYSKVASMDAQEAKYAQERLELIEKKAK